MKFYLIAGLFVLCLFVFFDYMNTKKENERLRDQVKSANSTITLQDNVAAQDASILLLERELIDEIENAPESDDAPTAPVLLNAIERLHGAP